MIGRYNTAQLLLGRICKQHHKKAHPGYVKYEFDFCIKGRKWSYIIHFYLCQWVALVGWIFDAGSPV